MSTTSGRRAGVVATRILIGAILLAIGLAVRQYADASTRIAAALERQTMTTASVAAEFDEAQEASGLVARVPIVGDRLTREIDHRRAEAAYWAGDYATLTADAPDPATDAAADPVLATLRATAMYRQLQGTRADTATLVRNLDAVILRYAEVMKQDPTLADAAINYEAVVRVREAVARGRLTNLRPDEETNAQGEAGAPPPESTPSDFNVIVPMRPDERQDQLDAGSGSVPVRKG